LTVQACLRRWSLVADGEPVTTPSSILLPVRRGGEPALLKIARAEEERRGGRLMAWWDGDGAARVLAQGGEAILLERATGPRSLAAMVAAGEDDEASRILCAVATRLHAPRRRRPPPELLPLSRWFEALAPAANALGGLLAEADAMAQRLLSTPRDLAVLHGDIHHGNVLDAGERGWIAIDPKGLWGERTFDFVNILRNPDGAIALRPARFAHQVEVLATAAALDRRRLIEWTLAFAGLSSAWCIADQKPAALDLAVAALAAAMLRS